MKLQLSRPLLVAAIVLAAGAAHASPRAGTALTQSELAGRVRQELASLPYYDMFDLLTFHASDEGVVTLGGYVQEGPLAQDAEAVVRALDGVRDVENRIEMLPVSITDDELRWSLFQAVFGSPLLARYATPSSRLAASLPRFSGPPFFGMEPVGDYAIHILVRNGEVTLAGAVERQAEKDAAERSASGVSGVSNVVNALRVASDE